MSYPSFTFRLGQDLLEIVKAIASERDRSIAWVVRHYLVKGLNIEGYIKEGETHE